MTLEQLHASLDVALVERGEILADLDRRIALIDLEHKALDERRTRAADTRRKVDAIVTAIEKKLAERPR